MVGIERAGIGGHRAVHFVVRQLATKRVILLTLMEPLWLGGGYGWLRPLPDTEPFCPYSPVIALKHKHTFFA
jgi:hypothetical protein